MSRLLVVDDDLIFCEALSSTLEEAGYQVMIAHTLERARELLKKQRVDVAFIDVFLPDGNGLDLLAGMALLPEAPEAIVITAKGDPAGAEAAITSGAWDYVQKPAHMDEILVMVQRAVEAHERKRSMPDFTGGSGIVAAGQPMRVTLLQMFEAAQSEAPVLISGETGTGKELIARAVHKNSRRSKGPFVVVDCGAISPTLLESELFGNVRGAFTGAVHSRHGLVALADKGTLFLDEVGELALDQQKAFLRLIQERRFRPLGSTEEVESNFRVVAATNRNLSEMAAGGTFRQDLLYRLQGVTIQVPPVRQRGEDVALLAQFALNRTLAQYGMRDKAFSPEVLEAMAAYPWPGNVREMLHAVEAAVLAAGDAPLVLLQHLPVHLRAFAVRTRVEERAPVPAEPADTPPAAAPPLAVPSLPSSAPEAPPRAALPPAPAQESPPPRESQPPNPPGDGKAPALNALAERTAEPVVNAAFPGTWKEFQDGALFAYKRRYLLSLLHFCSGNVAKAAKLAGLSRQRLYALLREHGIARHWEH